MTPDAGTREPVCGPFRWPKDIDLAQWVAGITDERLNIIRVLREARQASARQVWMMAGGSLNATKVLLHKMHLDGQVARVGDGKYFYRPIN